MTITLENYIIYIVDFYDGILSHSEQKELFAFLELNPLQKEEFDSFGQSKRIDFPEQGMGNDFKHQLKKICSEPMGRVTRNNIELYLTKEIEGELSQVEKIELADFIKQNPLFKRDRNLYKLAKIGADETIVLNKLHKQVLKKIAIITTAGINKKNADEWMILYFERQLTIAQEKDLLAFVSSNPAYQKDFELYKLTYLLPDKKVVFKDKRTLYIKAIRPLYAQVVPYLSAAVAACLVIYFAYNNMGNMDANLSVSTAQIEVAKPSEQIVIETPLSNSTNATFASSTSLRKPLMHHASLVNKANDKLHDNSNTIVAVDTNKPIDFNVVRLENTANSEEDMALENRIKQKLIEQELQQMPAEQDQRIVQVSGNGAAKVNWDQVAQRASSWVNKNTKFKVNVSKNIPQNINGKPVIIGNTVFFGGF
ncbi:MAG: hypothetical protein SGJ10_12340 [Bacteroidota bacterium]|nr:hypothetical protein [Bacteroidota bacterium]